MGFNLEELSRTNPNAYSIYHRGAESRQAEIDELQKRIDEALEFSENIHDENAIDKLYTIIEILKGKEND